MEYNQRLDANGNLIEAVRQPLPKPGDNTNVKPATSEARKPDLTYKLAHDCGIPLAGAQIIVGMIADLQKQIDELVGELVSLGHLPLLAK